MTYYGGLIASSIFGIWFLKREGVPLFRGMDIAAISISLGLVFGRLGCFLGGCCFGIHTDHPFGLSFPAFSPASESQWRAGLLEAPHLPSLPVHPTQLYEALGCLAITAFLLFWLRPRKRFDGQVFLSFIALYATLRFALEYWRADDRGELLTLSTSQLLAIPALVLVVIFWRRWSHSVSADVTARPPPPVSSLHASVAAWAWQCQRQCPSGSAPAYQSVSRQLRGWMIESPSGVPSISVSCSLADPGAARANPVARVSAAMRSACSSIASARSPSAFQLTSILAS